MPQRLNMPNGQKVDLDRIFVDDGEPAMMGNVGGVRTLLKDGKPALPRVAMVGKTFFFLDKDLTPVKTLEDIEVIPKSSKYRKAAEDFVRLQQEEPKRAEKMIQSAKPAKAHKRILRSFGAKQGIKRVLDMAEGSGRRPDDLEGALPDPA